MSFSKFCRGAVFSAAFCGFLGVGASLAQVQSGALSDPDLWTVGFLPSGETAFPEEGWAASDTGNLLALTRTVRMRNLSPVEQTLMRRLVLSAARAPEGDKSDDLLAERARLMFQIGEASAAAQLLPTLKKAPVGLDTEEVAVDLQLAIGQTDAACLNGVGEGQSGTFWVRLRAVCFALSDNYEEAELAMELAASQGVNDAWLTKAIFAASGALPNKPEARFDSGLALAISAKAGLEPSINTIANSRLDLAAAIARQDTFSPAMRVQAAGVAAEAGLLKASEHRKLYEALVKMGDFSPRTPLEVAVSTVHDAESDNGAKARALRAALRTAKGNAARYSAVSRLLLDDVKKLAPSRDTERMASDFIYASLAAGAPDEAVRWVAGSPGLDGDKFERTWVAGLMVLSGADLTGEVPDRGNAGIGGNIVRKTAVALVEASKSDKQKTAAARLFVLWDAMGIGLPPEARQVLADFNVQGTQNAIPPYLLASISAAATEQAGAEVVLQLIKLTEGDAYKLAPQDAGALMKALRTLGQEDAARMLALEATGFWRKSL